MLFHFVSMGIIWIRLVSWKVKHSPLHSKISNLSHAILFKRTLLTDWYPKIIVFKTAHFTDLDLLAFLVLSTWNLLMKLFLKATSGMISLTRNARWSKQGLDNVLRILIVSPVSCKIIVTSRIRPVKRRKKRGRWIGG